jgi:hypothetical protein
MNSARLTESDILAGVAPPITTVPVMSARPVAGGAGEARPEPVGAGAELDAGGLLRAGWVEAGGETGALE